MPPTLILIRHAQALHNVDPKDHSLPDPVLTEEGRRQCAELRENLESVPIAREAGLVVVSPMRRTCETATLALDWLLAPDEKDGRPPVKAIADALWQENGIKPCDTGTKPHLLAPDYPLIDFSTVDEVYPDKTSPLGAKYHYTRTAVLARAQMALSALYARPEKAIIVVSHSGFLRQGVTGSWFVNADYRVFDFEPREDENQPYRLRQWEETEARGGGMGNSWTHRVEIGADLPDEELWPEREGRV